jgi:multiple sugar transport system ATP-binding protein
LALADRIAVMEAGKLRQLGSPREVFARPANTFVANFIGSTPMNLLPGTVTSTTSDELSAARGSSNAAAPTGSASSNGGNAAGSASPNGGAAAGSASSNGGAAAGSNGSKAGSNGWAPGGAVGVVSVAGGSLPATTFSAPTGAEVTVGIRPEYLTLATGDITGPALRGTVVVAENLGTQSLVSVDCEGTMIGVTVPEEDEPSPGTTVVLTAHATRVLLYDRESGDLLARQPAPVA